MLLDERYWWGQLEPTFRGRRVIVTGEVVAALTPVVAALHRLGAARVLAIAGGGAGSGPPPPAGSAEVVTLGAGGSTMMASIRASQDALAHLPAEVLEQIDEFDPGHEAVVVGDLLTAHPEVAGRSYLAHRRPEWLALDDKVVIDGFWDRVGVDRAPAEVLRVDDAELGEVCRRLDLGEGVAVAADASQGWHGGAELLRRVRTPDEVDLARRFFAERAVSVRVMPFLEGIPCSIHGVVIGDEVLAVRPVEMLVLRPEDTSLWYSGCASLWDPPAADREAMRSLARRVGAALRAEVGFRGAFTIDGVMTADGFRPTELNPRNGAGMRVLTGSVDLPLQLLFDCVVAGVDADWRPRDLEALLVAAADEHRMASCHRSIPAVLEHGVEELVLDRGAFRTPAVGEPADVRVECGPSAVGSFLRATALPGRHPVGPSFAPVAAAFWRWADRRHGLGIGPLLPATEAPRSPTPPP